MCYDTHSVKTKGCVVLQAVQHPPLDVTAGHCGRSGGTEVLRVRGTQRDALQGRGGRHHRPGHRHGAAGPGPRPGVHRPHQQQRLRQAVRKWR